MSDPRVNETEPAHVSPRRRRHLRLALVVTLALVVALLAGQFFVLPMLLREQIESALHESGIDAVRFHIARATLWGADLTDVAAGDGSAVHLDHVALDFSLNDLRDGRLQAIRIIGASIRLGVRNGQFDLSPLRALIAQRPATTRPAADGGALPVGRIELTASKVMLITPHEEVEVPIGGTLIPQTDGRLSISLQIGEERAFVLGAELKNQQATFAGSADPGRTLLIVRAIWPDADVSADGKVKVSGQFDWRDHPAGGARLEILTDSGSATIPANPAGPQAKLHLSGGVFEVAARFDGSQPPLRLHVKDVAMALADQGFLATGINGDLALSSFSPLKTPPAQKISADSMKVGDMELKSGTLQFAMNDSSVMAVEHTEWTWLGGHVWADGFVVSGQPLHITLHAQGIELKDLLALAAQEKATGQGQIDAEIPLMIDGANVQFGTGSISSAKGGSVQIKDMEAIEPTAIAAAQAASGTASDQIKQNVIEALSDFQYDTLAMNLQTTEKGLVGHVHMKGHGRTGAKQPLDYELNVTGLDKVLRGYLRIREQLNLPHAKPAATTTGKADVK